MGLLNFYKIKFDAEKGNENGNNSSENYDKTLNDYTMKIKSLTEALTDSNDENDAEANKEGKELIETIGSTFEGNVMDYFKNNPEKLNDFRMAIYNCIMELKNKNGGALPEEYQPLEAFLSKVDKFINDEIKINGELQRITEVNGNFYEKQLDINSMTSKINDLMEKLGARIDDENQKKTTYRNTLINIKNIIEHPNSDNTKILQKFILSNLNNDIDFLNGNFKNGDPNNPDGLFGQHTLDGVNKFLSKLETSINIIVTNEQATNMNNPEDASSDVLDGNQDFVPEKLEKPEAPRYPLNGELGEIKKREESDPEPTYWSGLQKVKPENEDSPDGTQLYKTIEKIEIQLSAITDYENIEGVKDNIGKFKTTLDNIKAVIDNTTIDNVKALQKFIADNLDDNTKCKKSDFEAANLKNGKYDGKFGKGTLVGLDAVLTKVDDYISEVDKYKESMKTYNTLNNISGKNNVKRGETDANNLVNNKPADATVKFANENEKAKLEEPGTKKINLVVKLSDGTEHNMTVEVTVVESTNQPDNNPSSSDQLESSPASTTPLKMNDNDGEKKYLVMKNSNSLAQTYNLRGAIFYSTNVDNPESAGGDGSQPRLSESTGVTDGITEYFIKLSIDSPEVYKVKIENGCLCPIATRINTNLKYNNNSYVEKQILFMKNPSCMQYLRNKLPTQIKDCKIGWSEKKNDYNLESHGRRLTIEPMTIAGDWICRNEKDNPDYLSKNLAFLNLTNYIRSIGAAYNSPNPDVNRKVNKIKGIKVEGKQVHMNISEDDKDMLGLKNATSEELARFKRYNNGEHWNDNWDTKRKNKIYEKVMLS